MRLRKILWTSWCLKISRWLHYMLVLRISERSLIIALRRKSWLRHAMMIRSLVYVTCRRVITRRMLDLLVLLEVTLMVI